jgi:hypothetical protein
MAEEQETGLGTFCWTELVTRDITAAKRFYAELIGWRMVQDHVGGTNYTMLFPPGSKRPVGGMMAMDSDHWAGIPPHWMPYIPVQDVDDRARRCKELGGQVKFPPTDVPNIGRFCVIEDPTGAAIALFQGR